MNSKTSLTEKLINSHPPYGWKLSIYCIVVFGAGAIVLNGLQWLYNWHPSLTAYILSTVFLGGIIWSIVKLVDCIYVVVTFRKMFNKRMSIHKLITKHILSRESSVKTINTITAGNRIEAR